MGHSGDARDIRIEQRREQRRRGGLRWHERAWNWVQDFTVRYGFKPWRALFPALAVVLYGWFVFFQAGDSGVMRSIRTDDFVAFQSFVYSLDAFVPFVDLHQESHWLPDISVEDGSAVRVYLWVHILLGWALSGLTVIAFSGFMRRS